MKTLNRALLAFLLALSLLAFNTIPGQAANEVQFEVTEDGDYVVTLADGTRQIVPANLVGQISQALAEGDDAALSDAMAGIVSTNAGTNDNLAAAITGLATSLAPNRGGAITTGALRGAPNATNQILNTVQNTRGANFAQIVVAINNDPKIPPQIKQASTQQLANIQPAGGGQQGGGQDDADVDLADLVENPANVSTTTTSVGP
ncbi:MAG: hypothetical protein ACPHIA_07645 [Alphaproteobacteria bacterium]